MPLAPKDRLGPYEIVAPLGAGGMGEVYRARDTRLRRDVAIKMLPLELSLDSSRRERFEQEGRAISGLSHPHICSIFDVGQLQGLHYFVMELLEGETLAARLRRGPLALPEALSLATQIGEALHYAHRQGWLHRDLKPANIMLTGPKGDHAKLLDFGIAKRLAHPAAGAQAAAASSSTSTEVMPHTGDGQMMGTLPYMAPEQLEGREAGPRTDIFAFGALLYEMLTGRRAFAGASRVSLISAILRDDPAPLSSASVGPWPALNHVIRKCLAKDPEERWQTARDLVDELRWIAQSKDQLLPFPAGADRKQRTAWIAGALLALAAMGGAGVWYWQSTTSSVRSPARFEVPLPPGAVMGDFDYPVVSPDGTRVVFAAVTPDKKRELRVRRLDSLELQPLPGTEEATFPFWSPDSNWVAFFAQGQLKKAELGGGSPVNLAEAPGGIGGAWNQEGVIVFCPKLDSALYRVSASGGIATPLSRLHAARHQTSQFFPEFLPDGRRFLFYGVSAGREEEFNGAYAGSLDSAEVTPLFPTMGRVAYAAPGLILFPRGGSLLAQAFNAKTLRTAGEPFLVLESVGHLGAVLGSAYSATDRTLAYRPGVKTASLLTWIKDTGEPAGTLGPPSDQGNAALSRDGSRVAVELRDAPGQPRSLWLLDTRQGTRTRLTFDSGDHFNAVWSPDGSHVAFTSSAKGVRDIYQKPANGSGPEELIFASNQEKNLEDWSPDGSHLLFNTRLSGGPIEIWALPLRGERKPFKAVEGVQSSEQGKFSPDGRWIAYRSWESGREEIFVTAFPGSGRWQVSQGGGTDPRWRRDGRELYFLQDGHLMAVPVNPQNGAWQSGMPRPLFSVRVRSAGRNSYEPSPDGRKFLFSVPLPQTAANGFTVAVGWNNRPGR